MGGAVAHLPNGLSPQYQAVLSMRTPHLWNAPAVRLAQVSLLRPAEGDHMPGVDDAPAVLGGLDQLERHGDAGGLRARSLGPVPDGRERSTQCSS